MRARGTTDYGAVAKTLHWLILALLAIQFTLAWTMPGIPKGQRPEVLTNLHLSFGIMILAVMLVRLLWRLFRAVPPLPETLPVWQAFAARLVHWALYGLLIAMPLTGWAWASTKGWAVTPFGIGPLPKLLAPGSPLGGEVGYIHSNMATVILIVLGLHVAAALYHHVILGDDVLRRMLPQRRRPEN